MELSVMELRYQAVSPQTVHAWLTRYERAGLAALADRSHRPKGCAHKLPTSLEAVVLKMRRVRPGALAWESEPRILQKVRQERHDPSRSVKDQLNTLRVPPAGVAGRKRRQ
jgi:hypothetical protein